MSAEKKLVRILLAVTHISNNSKLAFHEKLRELLMEILACMEASRGSIMLLRGKNNLEVVASTDPDIIGLKQPVDPSSPSGWVFKNRTPLYVDKHSTEIPVTGKGGHYEKTAFLIVPILRNKKVIGLLSVTDKVGNDIFSEEEQDILIQMTGQVIGTLEMERLNASLKKSKKRLKNKNKQLKKLERLRTDLFNMLIHDLKGPLSEVIANLDILSYTAAEENRPFVETAQTGCDTLENMVSNLLDIARLEDGKLHLIYEKLAPRDLVKDAIGRICRIAQMKKVVFQEAFPSQEGPHHLYGDKSLVLRILQNLLTNAIQYSPPDETVSVGYEYSESSHIRFFVKDSGPGVPDESKEAIFDKFMQLEKKADGRIYTTGLGLTFCKMAVVAHRGKIGVQADHTKGSIFWFTLPLETQKAKAPF